MGTNYYLTRAGMRDRHIGKSSAGWRFLANCEAMGTWRWDNLQELLRDGVIVDEYGNRVSRRRLVRLIEGKAAGHSQGEESDGPVDFYHGEFS